MTLGTTFYWSGTPLKAGLSPAAAHLQAAASAAELQNSRSWWLDGWMSTDIIDFRRFLSITMVFIDYHQFSSIIIDFYENSFVFLDFYRFSLIFIDFHRVSWILGCCKNVYRQRVWHSCDALWHPVAPCGDFSRDPLTTFTRSWLARGFQNSMTPSWLAGGFQNSMIWWLDCWMSTDIIDFHPFSSITMGFHRLSSIFIDYHHF